MPLSIIATSAAKVLLPLSLLSPGVAGDADLSQTKSGEIVWRLPEGKEQASLSFDLDALKIGPRDYDEIHLHFKPRGGEVLWQPELTAYPVKGLRRHWYSKIPLQQNQWQTARLSSALFVGNLAGRKTRLSCGHRFTQDNSAGRKSTYRGLGRSHLRSGHASAGILQSGDFQNAYFAFLVSPSGSANQGRLYG